MSRLQAPTAATAAATAATAAAATAAATAATAACAFHFPSSLFTSLLIFSVLASFVFFLCSVLLSSPHPSCLISSFLFCLILNTLLPPSHFALLSSLLISSHFLSSILLLSSVCPFYIPPLPSPFLFSLFFPFIFSCLLLSFSHPLFRYPFFSSSLSFLIFCLP
jgi:hypothetical protein